MIDRLHILTATGSLLLTKRYQADGTVKGHGNAKWHKLDVAEVSNLRDLSALLTRLEAQPQSCVIRGAYKGDAVAIPHFRSQDGYKPGLIARQKDAINDQMLHSIMIDIDKYECLFHDPVADAEAAIQQYISERLPPQFALASFHWQLSAGAGVGANAGILKAHVWFWLRQAHTSEELRDWAKSVNRQSPDALDIALYDTIQAHYTANPVFDHGVTDPVAVRSGFYEGLSDDVELDAIKVEVVAHDLASLIASDPVAKRLKDLGMVYGLNSNRAALNIKCPRDDLHGSKTSESSTVYYIKGTRGYEAGAFKCQHSHCLDARQEDFLSRIEVDALSLFGDSLLDGFKDDQAKQRVVTATRTRNDWIADIQAVTSDEDLTVLVERRIAKDTTLSDIDRAILSDAVRAAYAAFGIEVTKAVCDKMVKFKAEKNTQPTILTQWPLTEFGNARRFAERYAGKAIYVPEIVSWFLWNGDRWHKASGVMMDKLAKDSVYAMEEIAKRDDIDQAQRLAILQFCEFSQQARMVSNVLRLAQSEPEMMVPVSELDKHWYLLGVRNGVVDLRDGTFRKGRPDDYVTIAAGCAFDAPAVCPLFDQTVLDVFKGDHEMVEFFVTCLGYALRGKPTEDMLFIPFGSGSNGKSTILNAVRRVFGSYAKAADAATFVSDGGKSGNAGGAREDLVRLRGARFVYVNEPDEGGELREGSVKSMTGGDTITARTLYATESVEITPTWTVFMPTNHKPIVKGTDEGVWRRLTLIPFERNFDKDPTVVKDTNREEKLLAEMPGILNRLIHASLRYQREGLALTAAVRAARDEYRNQMDLLAEWLEECCEMAPSFNEEMAKLWESWEGFSKRRGLAQYVRSSVALGKRLDARFPSFKGTGGVRKRHGIRLKDVFRMENVNLFISDGLSSGASGG